MRIFRQQVQVRDIDDILTLPWPATITHVAPCRDGGNAIDIWYIDPQNEEPTELGRDDDGRVVIAPTTERVRIHVAGTGDPIPSELGSQDFVGTCVMSSGHVWHVFAQHDEPKKI